MTDAPDVLVIGAGPAGSALACALADRGRSVMIWERLPHPPLRKVGETLPAAARPLLRDLGLDALWSNPAHLPSPGARVLWESQDIREVDALRDPQGQGLHLNRTAFEQDLWRAVEARGIPRRVGAFRRLRRAQQRFRLFERLPPDAELPPFGATDPHERWHVESNQICRPRLIVDASGRSAVVVRALGARRHFDTRLLALVQWRRRLPEDRDQRILIEATEDGWWYSAPLAGVTGPERVFAFHTAPPLAQQLRQSDEAWEQALHATRLLAPVAGGAPMGERTARGAGGVLLAPPGGPGWLAVGDAALAFEPLSSQGLFNALYCALRGAQAIDAALDGDPQPGMRYGRTLADVRRRYLAHQRAFHNVIQRFPDSPFWRHRVG